MKVRAAIDAAWTGVMLGALAVVFRAEIGRVLTNARASMEARERVVREAAEQAERGRGYLLAIRDRIVAEEGLVKLDTDCGCPDA